MFTNLVKHMRAGGNICNGVTRQSESRSFTCLNSNKNILFNVFVVSRCKFIKIMDKTLSRIQASGA